MIPKDEADIRGDILDAIQSLDNDYLDDVDATLSIGIDSEDDSIVTGQIFYTDGREAEIEIYVLVTTPKDSA